MQIIGIEGMTTEQLNEEIKKGGKFVIFQYCVSIIVMTFRRPSNIYFIKSGESASKSWGFTLVSLVLGWWGIPWGPIYTIGALVNNLQGGKDVTAEVIASFNKAA